MFESLRLGRTRKAEYVERDEQSTMDTSTLSFTGSIANWSARHRWWVVAASVLVLVMAVFVSSAVEPNILDDNEFAEGESGKAIRLLRRAVR